MERKQIWLLSLCGTPDMLSKLSSLLEGSTTLHQLGFKVTVGNVVWNAVKDQLTMDSSKTLLVYSGDISDNQLEVKDYVTRNPAKKNYLERPGRTDLLLVVNRGYGKGKYKFNYCLLDLDRPYLVENHLICISNTEEISRQELKQKYQQIITSLKNTKTQKFVDLYFSNDAINTNELENVLPIYLSS